MHLIVGLGNPGSKYSRTRHNVGFRAVDYLASRYKIRMWRSRFQGKYGKGRISGRDVALLKPRLYMNRSGYSVYDAVTKLGIPFQRLLVISDDITLPAGKTRLRAKGSDGGHKGLRSIIEELDTCDFPRLRIGVGPVPEYEDTADFVLSEPATGEHDEIQNAVELACSGITVFIENGIDTAIAHTNR